MKNKVLYWIPRVITIIAILFMMMFSLDVFAEKQPIGKQLLGFLIHNIPAFVLTGILIIAWKWEMVGGILFICLTIIMSIWFRSFAGNPYSLIVIGPFLITGVLFILHKILADRKIETSSQDK